MRVNAGNFWLIKESRIRKLKKRRKQYKHSTLSMMRQCNCNHHTRKHSSRMRTVRCSDCRGGVSARGVSAGGIISARHPLCEHNDWQTGVKTLPCQNFVADGNIFEMHWRVWGVFLDHLGGSSWNNIILQISRNTPCRSPVRSFYMIMITKHFRQQKITVKSDLRTFICIKPICDDQIEWHQIDDEHFLLKFQV